MFSYIRFTLRIALGLLFIGAGITKFIFLGDFIQSVSEFGIVLDQTVSVFAIAICVAEIVGGVGLLFRIRGSVAFLSGLIGCFIGALVYGRYLGLDIDCGCFGPTYHVDLLTQIMIDAIILVGLGLIGWTGRTFVRKNTTQLE